VLQPLAALSVMTVTVLPVVRLFLVRLQDVLAVTLHPCPAVFGVLYLLATPEGRSHPGCYHCPPPTEDATHPTVEQRQPKLVLQQWGPLVVPLCRRLDLH
jgi:hypothetical protein